MASYGSSMTASALGSGLHGIGSTLMNISSDRRRRELEDQDRTRMAERDARGDADRDRAFEFQQQQAELARVASERNRQEQQLRWKTEDERSGFGGTMIDHVAELPGVSDPRTGMSSGPTQVPFRSGTYIPGTDYDPERDAMRKRGLASQEDQFGFQTRLDDRRHGQRLAEIGASTSASTTAADRNRAATRDQLRARNQAIMLIDEVDGDWDEARRRAGDNPDMLDAISTIQADILAHERRLPGAPNPAQPRGMSIQDVIAQQMMGDMGFDAPGAGFGISGRSGAGGTPRTGPTVDLEERRRDWDRLAEEHGEDMATREIGPRP